MNEKDDNIISFEIDLSDPPPLTAKQAAALEALNQMPDSEIDCSDIPDKPFFFHSS
jgi:hypothetical protein